MIAQSDSHISSIESSELFLNFSKTNIVNNLHIDILIIKNKWDPSLSKLMLATELKQLLVLQYKEQFCEDVTKEATSDIEYAL